MPSRKGARALFKRIGKGKKKIKARAVGARRLLTAMGVIAGKATGAGPGRPRGTYKYGLPIHQYKRLQAQKKSAYLAYKQEQLMRLGKRGITAEQLQQMQLQRTLAKGLPPPPTRLQDEPEQMVDEELDFKRWEADKSLSPSARALLTRLRRVQNKGKLDNIRQQRIQKERRMISEKSNLMKAHENMIPVRLDFTGVSQNNILKADNIFRENPEDNILKPKRLNILQTRESGNTLKF